MTVIVKIEEFGEESGIILPESVLSSLNAKAGDHLEFVMSPDGLILRRYDSHFAEKMAAVRHVMTENREVLKRLAES